MTQGIGLHNSPTTPLLIAHIWHSQHPLTLETGGPYTCDGCKNPSPAGGTRYSCRGCNYDLDWTCAMSNPSSWSTLPDMIPHHFLHPQHPLTLQGGGVYHCNGCGHVSPGGGVRYCCLTCNFDLDCSCANSPPPSHLHPPPFPGPLLPMHGPFPPMQGPLPPMTGPLLPMTASLPPVHGYGGVNIRPQCQNQGGSGFGRGKRAKVKAFISDLKEATVISYIISSASYGAVLHNDADTTNTTLDSSADTTFDASDVGGSYFF